MLGSVFRKESGSSVAPVAPATVPATSEPLLAPVFGVSPSESFSVRPGICAGVAARVHVSGKVSDSAPTDAELLLAGASAFDDPEWPATKPPTATATITAAATASIPPETGRRSAAGTAAGAPAGASRSVAASAAVFARVAPGAATVAPPAPAACVASPASAGCVGSPPRAARVTSGGLAGVGAGAPRCVPDWRVDTLASAARMPASSGVESGPGGLIAARVRVVKADCASCISAVAESCRWSGSFDIALRITASSWPGSSGRSTVTAGGSSDMCAYSTAASESFAYGTTPVRHS